MFGFLRKKKAQILPEYKETVAAVVVQNNGLIKQTAEERIEGKIIVHREEARQIALVVHSDKFCDAFLTLAYKLLEFDAHKLNAFDDEELFVLVKLLGERERVNQERDKRSWLTADISELYWKYKHCLDSICVISGNENYFPIEQLRNKIKSQVGNSQNKQEEVNNG